ncbi:MAG: hypothetical protein HKN73_10190 [Gemmatimonadetes bacterium]|nr:hypothetical protein [Gemmatimonadota bacterium]
MSTPVGDLAQLKRQAKELLKSFRAGDPEAQARVAAHFAGADSATFRLAQAQLVLARSLGYASWARLRAAAGALPAIRRARSKPTEMGGQYVNDVDPVDGEKAWALFQACRDGDMKAAELLLDEDPALVHAQYWYTHPVHLAAYANRPELVRLLFDRGAEPGRTRFAGGWLKLEEHSRSMGFGEVGDVVRQAAFRRFGYSPDFGRLRDAIVSRDPDRIRTLLSQEPDLAKATDLEGNSAVHWAVMTRQPEVLRDVVRAGADPNRRRGDGQTPAHLLFIGDYHFRVWRELAGVAHADVSTMLQTLLEAGAEKDLSVACATGDTSAARALLESDPVLARRLDSGRRNPITFAARGGHHEVARLLLEHGCDPSAPEERAPRGMALWEACSRGDVEMVRLLLQGGADPASAPDSSDSCLGIARARAGDRAEEIVGLLQEAGAEPPPWHMSTDELAQALRDDADAFREPWFGEEVLARNDVELARLLLQKDPGLPARLDGSRLRMGDPHMSVSESEVLRLLLEHGFDPNRPGWLGQTALHHYAGRGEAGNVLLVIEHGADLDATDDEHHGTPMAWAAAEGHGEVVQLLLEHGADPGLPTSPGPARPLERARRAGHQAVVELLEEASRPGEATP